MVTIKAVGSSTNQAILNTDLPPEQCLWWKKHSTFKAGSYYSSIIKIEPVCVGHEEHCARGGPSALHVHRGRDAPAAEGRRHRGGGARLQPEFLALKHESRILGHSSNPVFGFSMIKQVRLCTVWPMKNWLGPSSTGSKNPTLVL